MIADVLTLAREGRKLFPIQARGKTPLISDWPSKATADESQLKAWDDAFPRCNWGMVTGAKSEVFVIDVDGEAGNAWCAEQTRLRGESWLTSTRRARTARGMHLFFRLPNGVSVRNSAGKIAQGVDVRADGGYVVIPPSVHPDGSIYSWIGPATLSPALAQSWLLALATNASKLESSPAISDSAGIIPEGERNASLASLAGSMRRRGASQDAITAALLAENKRACNPPLSESEVSAIAESVARYQPVLRVRPIRSNATTQTDLLRSENGSPRAVVENVLAMLRRSADWAGVLAYNEFTNRTVLQTLGPGFPPAAQDFPREWTDRDTVIATGWMQRQGILIHSMDAVGRAVQTVARENSFHPVRDFLRPLSWDQTPRITTWLPTYLGAPDTPYTRTVGSCWLISAVARVMRPGVQADATILLQGAQGIGKSSGLRALVGDQWFSDHLSPLATKDSRLELQGRWVVEISELSAMHRSEIETVKAYLTQRFDSFRAPYARTTETIARQNVFAATTNDEAPLTDASGNRRFWPISCGKVQIQKLEQDREQIWAEAYAAFLQKQPWWLTPAQEAELARPEQESRFESGPWDDLLARWIDRLGDAKAEVRRTREFEQSQLPWFGSTSDRISISDAIIHAVGKDVPARGDEMLVARFLKHRGWKRKRETAGPFRRRYFYYKPEGGRNDD